MARASQQLEDFIDESIRVSKEHGYNPTVFVSMRHDLGTLPAISKLAVSPDLQSGFRKLRELGLLTWSIEAAVLKFPSEFSADVRAAAEWRLNQVAKA